MFHPGFPEVTILPISESISGDAQGRKLFPGFETGSRNKELLRYCRHPG